MKRFRFVPWVVVLVCSIEVHAADEDEKRFSKTGEITLSMGSIDFMLDLDTGKTMDPPAASRPEQARMDIAPAQIQPYITPTELNGFSLRGFKIESKKWNASAVDIRNLIEGKKMPLLSRMAFDPESPATFLFRTREGTEGILQITKVTEDPVGFLIRYKTFEE